MAIKGQNSCTLSTITDVKSIYTYHLLAPSTTVITNNMAPKDATTDNPGNPPGASSITITYLGHDYTWTISEPGINIQTNDIGTLYYIECTLFSNDTFDWGPIMTSSSYEAAKQAFNKATIVTNLVGDSPQHFWWLTTGYSTDIPAGAYITYVSQESFKNNPNNQPNLLLQSEGISLRNGLTTKAQMTSTGLEVLEGGIKGGQPNTSGYIYLSTIDYPLKDSTTTPPQAGLTINGHIPTASGTDGKIVDDPAWRAIVGTNFGVDSEGNLYASGANIEGKVTVTSGSNVYTTDEVNPLEIGGRNLFIGSKFPSESRETNGLTAVWNKDDLTWTVSGTNTEKTKSYGFGYPNPNSYKHIYFKTGDIITAALELVSGSADGLYLGVNFYNKSGSQYGIGTCLAGESLTYTFKDTHDEARPCASIFLGANKKTDTVDCVLRIKIEKGNKATDWTPAPEDVQAEIDAKKSTFTVNATGTDASQSYAQILAWAEEGKQLTWAVDSTAGIKAGDTVRVKTTVSNMSNAPVYVVTTCRETPTSSTSIKTTSHGLDTTIIDGGNILTNSIGAIQIQANAITADKIAANAITIGDMNQDAKDKVLNSNINVGGRNLLGGTANTVVPVLSTGDANNSFGSVARYNSPASEFSLEGYDETSKSMVITSSVTGNRGVGWYTHQGDVVAGETYTFSCRVKSSVAATVHTHTAWRNGSATAGYTGWTSGGSVSLMENVWTDYSYTFTPSANANLDWEFMVALCFTGQTTGVICRIAHAKFEKGNKVTDWDPAPAELSATATSYITKINEEGITIHPEDPTSRNYLQINSDGISINTIKGTIAQYGESIRLGDSSTYLEITSNIVEFFDNKKSMAKFGYDEIFESYGVQGENIFIKGAGNALRLDNNVNGTYQGQYILETRANGHLSLKPGLRRTEEEV